MARDGVAYPDTVVGTDSHTTMVNGLGVLGWGVGGIEAEAAMLGQPVSMLIPRVVGFKLNGELPDGTTATDLVLTITQMLRKHGVVGKFVEFYGSGVAAVPLANRATIGNMSPEFGSTCAIFPIDAETVRYLTLTGRAAAQVALVEAYAKEQGLWHDPRRRNRPIRSTWSWICPLWCPPSPARSGRRTGSRSATPRPPSAPCCRTTWTTTGSTRSSEESFPASDAPASNGRANGGRAHKPTPVTLGRRTASFELDHGAVVIASITSCTNTSNPQVMIGAALLARKAVERGLTAQAVGEDHPGAGVQGGHGLLREGRPGAVPGQARLQPGRLRLHHLHRQLRPAARGGVRRGQRGRPRGGPRAVRQPQLRGPDQPGREDELPRLAAAGGGVRDRRHDGHSTSTTSHWAPTRTANRCTCATSGPPRRRSRTVIDSAISSEMFTKDYADVFAGDERWQSLPTPTGETFAWDGDSTYVRKPPYFEGMAARPAPVTDIAGARVLAKLGDSVTTDHISPAGSIKADSPAGRYLPSTAWTSKDFNSYGSRRGNHEVMIRGTFANIRLRNQLVPGVEGGFTVNFLTGEQTTHLRRLAGLRGGGRAAGDPGRQGVRLGLVARLGGQGHHAARASGRSSPSRTSASTAPT